MNLSASQSRGVLLVILAASCGALIGIIGLLVGSQALAIFGGLAAMWLPVAAALLLLVSERRRHDVIERSLQAQADFLERLVESMGRIADATGTDSIIPITRCDATVRTIEVQRDTPFTRTDAVRATVLADFSSGAVQKAGLLTEAREDEDEDEAN